MSWIILLLAGCLIPNDARAQLLEHGSLVKEFPQGRPPIRGELPPNTEQVEGSLVAKDRPDEFRPKEKLETGSLVQKFEQPPQQNELRRAIARSGRAMPRMMGEVDKVPGNVLDENVQVGRYVPNPTKVLAELLYDPKHLDELQEHSRHGEHMLDVVEGEVVAGDPASLDVLDVKGDFAEHLQKHVQQNIKHHLPEHMTKDGEHVIQHEGPHGEPGGKSSSEEIKQLVPQLVQLGPYGKRPPPPPPGGKSSSEERKRFGGPGGGSSSSEEGGSSSSSEEGPMNGKPDTQWWMPRPTTKMPMLRMNCQQSGDSCSPSIDGHCCSGSCGCQGGNVCCCDC